MLFPGIMRLRSEGRAKKFTSSDAVTTVIAVVGLFIGAMLVHTYFRYNVR